MLCVHQPRPRLASPWASLAALPGLPGPLGTEAKARAVQEGEGEAQLRIPKLKQEWAQLSSFHPPLQTDFNPPNGSCLYTSVLELIHRIVQGAQPQTES